MEEEKRKPVVKTLSVKPTVGEVAAKLLEKAESNDQTVIDQTREQLSEYYDELIKCVNEHKNKIVGNFYVVVITKKERLITNVLRNYFFARVSCPTPDYDQAVYHYDAKKEELSFMWVIPDRETCLLLRANTSQIPQEELQLLGFVQDFASGKLFKLAKSLNGEKVDSIEIEN